MKATLVLANRQSELAPVLDRLEAFLSEEAISAELIREVRLLAEEGISNIIFHAYECDETQSIEVTLAVEAQEIRLELVDEGRPFDPLQAPSPGQNRSRGDQATEGLGILMMRSLADEASYVRERGRNVLVLKKRF